MAEVFVGVDVSMDWIDVFEPGSGVARIENVPAELAAFARRMKRKGVGQVVFEASGGYDAPLRAALEKAGVRLARVNPGKARHFAKAIGVIGKTDRVDARMLSEMGARLDLPNTAPLDPVRQVLRELAARRRQLVETRKQEQTRLRQVTSRFLRASITRHIRQLDTEIDRIEVQIAETVRSNEEIARLFDRLCTAPGVGPITAATLIAEMAELGTFDRRRIAALAGLAPIARDSGKRSPARSIAGGRPVVRPALYLAALQASRWNEPFREFRQRLEERGRTPKQAIIAVARKLLTALNAMVRDNADFKPAIE